MKSVSLTGFQLKYLALILMLLDHIHYFFEFTGKIPLWFTQLGRLAAPLFLFCLVEGFCHTSNRKAYFKKIYGLAILMGVIQFGFYNVLAPLVRADGFFPQNMMLSSFSIVLVCLQGLAWIREQRYVRGWVTFLLPILLPFVMLPIFQIAIQTKAHAALFWLNLVSFTVLPLHTSIADGGTVMLLLGVALYLCRNNRLLQVFAFASLTLLWTIGLLFLMGVPVTITGLGSTYFEWMSVFAAVPMLLYNGEKGHGNQAFFYLFYPVHIYVLYSLSIVYYH